MEIEEVIEIPNTPKKAMISVVPGPKLSNARRAPPLALSVTFSASMMHENIENAGVLITKWDPQRASLEKFTSLFQENQREAKEFVKCVEGLRKAMHFLVAQHAGSTQLVVANKLMKAGMHRLEKEFYHILAANRKCLNPESISSESSHLSRSWSFGNSDVDDYNDRVETDGDVQMSKIERTMSDLRLIGESMISSGYSKECGKIYTLTRKSIVEEELYRLGIGAFTQSQVNRMDRQVLENHVNKWVDAAKIAVSGLFRGERLLCDHVFAVSETIKQACIAQATMEGALNLFRFPEFVAKGKRFPDKIFLLMNLYEAISDLWPEIEVIFSYESLSPIKLQALSSMHKLSHSIQMTLSEFEATVQKNSSKTPIPGGGIHPMTVSVMEYVSGLASYSGTLANILAGDGGDRSSVPQSPFPESYFDSPNPNSGVSSRLAWMILVLLCKLDRKAELYKDAGLSYLFLANNLQFVVEKVSTTTLKLLLGQDWVTKLQKKVNLYATNYESIAWSTVLSSLPHAVEGAESPPHTTKERFRQFYSAFEAAYRKQISWVVPNSKLRDAIKLSIARKLVPAYREFYNSYVSTVGREKNLEVQVRFSPDNLGNFLSDLFYTTDLVRWNSTTSVRQLNPGVCRAIVCGAIARK